MRFMRDVGLDDRQIVGMPIGGDDRYPKGLEPARYCYRQCKNGHLTAVRN
ncbi:hypothetical protein AABM17_1397 [Neisseria musculi]|uniref:Uncharacterized protein n=1 Tax=Neisseria musculi TaxID=1815583 RepID=A0A7H1MF24_9NEIS|nr:hypothetical protein H7A79_1397 [Neisseria musculi]